MKHEPGILSYLIYQVSIRAKVAGGHEKPCVESYSVSIIKASSGIMLLVKAMYRDVTQIETVEVSEEEFFDKSFHRHLMLGTGEARSKK
jgi:hypothetical protein